MDKPIYLGFAVLELSRLHMSESYDKLQPYFGENIQLHYMDTDCSLLSINSANIIRDLQNLEDLFEFSNMSENLEISSLKKRRNSWWI